MISAVVLGAGSSTRFGEPKQLLKVGSETMLETIVRRFLESRVDEVVLVLGFRADEILKDSKFGRARIVLNPAYEQGLGSSLRVGIDVVDPRASAAVVALGDQPLVSVTTIDSMLQRYSETRGLIVAPYFQRRRGNPVLFDRRLFPELRRIGGDSGAKGLIERMQKEVVKVQVDDIGVVADVDTKEDLLRLRDRFEK
ncbi:MAG: nucleotidyltransferase family protein [Thaumarchaeota archaeon]|nr:nucleotidyltransferase family protein [Nitrososphaerota archaeon]